MDSIKSLVALAELASRNGHEGDALAVVLDLLRDLDESETPTYCPSSPRRATTREQIQHVLELSKTHSRAEIARLTDLNKWAVSRIKNGQNLGTGTSHRSASRLTVKEITDIIQCFDEGMTIKEISYAADLDYHTVYNVAHRKNQTAKQIGRQLDRTQHRNSKRVAA